MGCLWETSLAYLLPGAVTPSGNSWHRAKTIWLVDKFISDWISG